MKYNLNNIFYFKQPLFPGLSCINFSSILSLGLFLLGSFSYILFIKALKHSFTLNPVKLEVSKNSKLLSSANFCPSSVDISHL